MKKILFSGMIALSLVAVMFLASCELEEDSTVSITERVSKFETDLNNGNYDNIYLNFHTDMLNRDQAKDELVTSTSPLRAANAPFDFSTPETTAISGSEEMTAAGTMTNGLGATLTYTFTMKEESTGNGNWLIRIMTVTSGDTDFTLRKIVP